ncbi:nitroreductase/quinone reductase family protein [Nocardia sp. NBC_01503]|uniref:nitroreductase/quinone reductase family protein n=1 Tax=Nocardia sp. NBC_01503 TaxID=2975997 RepID=UPI002E7B3552|nr:nitroreductase/quinone reductase family protein [Nocardia sp. NBC_01503]WTL29836.1 nitroreductase/quinone reductase family protein [Nocardia sp. NBC_01503]
MRTKHDQPAREKLTGIMGPVDYTAPVRYRPGPALYRRLQPLGSRLTLLGLSPDYAVVLEVPGRRSGVIHRTNLVRVEHDGNDFLVSLSGESEWVRNVRACAGRVVIGRRRRRAATLTEIQIANRPPVIRAYLRRAGRTGRSWGTALEARHYFGVTTDPSDAELHRIAERYPVFRVDYYADPH